MEILTFQLNFVLEAYLMNLTMLIKGNVYDFSVDYSAIDKSNILNIHKYLMIKNNI